MKYVKTVMGIKLYEKKCEGHKCSSSFLISSNNKQLYCSRDCKDITSWARNKKKTNVK